MQSKTTNNRFLNFKNNIIMENLTSSAKLDFILCSLKNAKLIFEIGGVKKKGLLNQALKDRISYYKSRENDLNNLSFEKLQNHSFQRDLSDRYTNLIKVKEVDTIIKKYFIKLEFHTYAPELNKAFFQKNNQSMQMISVKGCYTKEDVFKYLITNLSSNEVSNLHNAIKKH